MVLSNTFKHVHGPRWLTLVYVGGLYCGTCSGRHVVSDDDENLLVLGGCRLERTSTVICSLEGQLCHSQTVLPCHSLCPYTTLVYISLSI